MCDKMAISAYILKVVEKDLFLRLQMRAKEIFNRHQFIIHQSLLFSLNQKLGSQVLDHLRLFGTSGSHVNIVFSNFWDINYYEISSQKSLEKI